MARNYKQHEVHSITYIFVGLLLILTLAGIAPLFNNQLRVYQSKATTGCAPAGACQSVHTPCCQSGSQPIYSSACGSIPYRCTILPTVIRANTPTPTRPSGLSSCRYGTAENCIANCSGGQCFTCPGSYYPYKCIRFSPTPNIPQ